MTTQPLNMTLPLPMKKTENQLDKQTMKNLKENFKQQNKADLFSKINIIPIKKTT